MVRKLRQRKCKECKENFTPTSKVNNFCSKVCGTKFRSKTRVTCKYCKKSINGYVPEKGEEYRKKFCNLTCYGKWLKEAPDEDKHKKGLSMDLDQLLDDLVPFLKIGLELQPACNEIGVAYSTVHNYTTSTGLSEKYPELEVFKNEIQKAKNYGIKVCKNVIVSEIANNKNYKAAFDYLDRVDPTFAPKEEETEEFEFGFSKSAFVTGGIPKEEKESKEPTQTLENEPREFKIKIKKTKCLQNQRRKEG